MDDVGDAGVWGGVLFFNCHLSLSLKNSPPNFHAMNRPFSLRETYLFMA